MTEQTTTTKIPNNHVIAVLPSDGAIKSAISDLTRNGFDDNTVLRGEGVTNEVDPKAENSGAIGNLARAVGDHLSEEQNFLAQYQEEARSGNAVLAIHVKDKDQAEAATQILEKYSARNIRFFGKLAVTDLSPLSNPSTRSEDSAESKNWSKA
jgi:hypothetical protein